MLLVIFTCINTQPVMSASGTFFSSNTFARRRESLFIAEPLHCSFCLTRARGASHLKLYFKVRFAHWARTNAPAVRCYLVFKDRKHDRKGSQQLSVSLKATSITSPAFVDPALAHDEITRRLIQVLIFRHIPQHARPFASLPVIDSQPMRRPRKKPLFVVFCLILAVSPSSAELAWCSCFTNFWSFDTSVSLFPPLLLR